MSTPTASKPSESPNASASALSIALVGNPNTGKTTLFNALTGLRHRVGNYPGVTVETKTGFAKVGPHRLEVTDLPGTYSLSPRSADEMVAVDILLGHRREVDPPRTVVAVVDASNLSRNLYLVTQVLELGVPVVLALNMGDVAKSKQIEINADLLAEQLGVPVVPIQANSGKGLDDLKKQIVESATNNQPPTQRPEFPDLFQQQIEELSNSWKGDAQHKPEPFLLERALIDIDGPAQTQLVRQSGPEFKTKLLDAREKLKAENLAVPALEAKVRYRWISERLREVVAHPEQAPVTFTDRIDRILLHKIWGVLIFVGIMTLMFQTIFSWAGVPMDFIDELFGTIGGWVGSQLPEGPVADLIVDGVIAGVGGVVIFLPQIVILFGFIAILEDCGYMARAAFLMDKLMAKCGLSGKSFIPMLSSFACAIPGIMAARTIEDRRDRLATILVAPLMSCSARLPVYILLIAAFIPNYRWGLNFNVGTWNIDWTLISLPALVMLSMYLVGMIVAPLVAWALKKTVLPGPPPVFMMELPSYKMPSIRTVLYRMYDRGLAFLKRAGTIILAASIVIWALAYYPRNVEGSAQMEKQIATYDEKLEQFGEDDESTEKTKLEDERSEIANELAYTRRANSYLGQMGKAVEPVVKPLGWDWKIGMAAIASFPAREVIISALGIIYHVGDEADEESEPLKEKMKAERWPDSGKPIYNIPVALSIMVFFALCAQCAATIAVIKREANSWGWAVFSFVYMTVLAYIGALVTYQVGMLFM